MPSSKAVAAASALLLGCLAAAGAAGAPRILIAGDSTASTYPAARAPQTGWGQALPYFVADGVAVVNRAASGRSTKSFIDEGKWTALVAEIHPGDVVLISFGHNDSRDDDPERYTKADGAFRANLVRFADEVTANGAVPVILSPAARRLWEGPAMVETHGLYAENARLAAVEAGAAFIDLSNLSITYFETLGREGTKRDFLWLTPESANARFPDGVEDNTHFTELGACGVARVIAAALLDIAPPFAGGGLVNPRRIGPEDSSSLNIAGDPIGPQESFEDHYRRPPRVTACAARMRIERESAG